MSETITKKQVIRIYVFEHKPTGLLLARSDDLYGLVVHGHSEEEIFARLPSAIRDIVDANGFEVVSLDVARDTRLADYTPAAYIANAAMTERHR